jgi:hypothetical protein
MSASLDGTRSEERKRLQRLIEELGQREAEFHEADAQGNAPMRRELRAQRNQLIEQIHLVLAQLGETDLLKELRRLPVDRKVQQIQRYLRQPVMQADAARSLS